MLCVCGIYIQSFDNFENNEMKLSVNEAKLTGLLARNGATIQQVWILNLPSDAKFSGLSIIWPADLKDDVILL